MKNNITKAILVAIICLLLNCYSQQGYAINLTKKIEQLQQLQAERNPEFKKILDKQKRKRP